MVINLKCPFGHSVVKSEIANRVWYCKVCQRLRGNGYYPMDETLPFAFYERHGIPSKLDPFKNPKINS